jgi:phage baseplate assembly protein W
MAQYVGFSTINANKPPTTNMVTGADGGNGGIVRPIIIGKKYRLTDAQLVVRDFINALNIPLGSKVGQPGYGTTLWSFVFEPNTPDMQFQLENEIRRVASQDPRLIINYVRGFPKENGILMETELAVAPFNQPQVLNVFFNGENGTAIQFQ